MSLALSVETQNVDTNLLQGKISEGIHAVKNLQGIKDELQNIQ
jgi:hypothetical protein